MTTQSNTLQVANTIRQQIGNRAFLMMGSKHLLGSENSLSFDVRGSRFCSHIRIVLDPSDTYTVEFIKCRKYERKIVKSLDMVYFDCLHRVIELNTGLYLSFGGAL